MGFIRNILAWGQKKLYKIDTHVHTSEVSKCGKVDAQTAVRSYIAHGYSGIVITDHFYETYFESFGEMSWEEKINIYLQGYKKSCNEAAGKDFVIYSGMEIRFPENENDYLVFGLDENFLFEHPYLYKLGLEKFNRLAHDNGLLIYQAHPFRNRMVPADPYLLDGMEVLNGNPRHDSRDNLADEYASRFDLKKLSGSDFHQTDDIARGGIVVSELPRSNSGLVALLRENRYKLIK
jgi:predicted metal-dependent phosphoesterase TrpH